MLHLTLIVGIDVHPREIRLEGDRRRFDPRRFVDLLLFGNVVEEVLIERGELDGRTNEYSSTESGYDVLYAKFAWQAEQIGTDEQHAEELRTVVAEATEKGQ